MLTTREAVPADADALARLKADVEGPVYEHYGTAAEHAADMARYASAAYVLEVLARPATTVLIAEDDGEIVGMVALTSSDPGHAFLFSLAVRRPRLGVGSLLVTMAAVEADRRGRDRIECEVFGRNAEALKFFDSFGFVACGGRPSQSYPGQDLTRLCVPTEDILDSGRAPVDTVRN